MYYGFLEELIYFYAFLPAFFEGVRAKVFPAEHKTLRAVAELFYPYRENPAGERLADTSAAPLKTLLYSAERIAVLVGHGIGTSAVSLYQRGYRIPVPVHDKKALGLDGRSSVWGQYRRIIFKLPFKTLLFRTFKRGPAVADDTAAALAFGIVTAETLRQDFRAYKIVADFKNHPLSEFSQSTSKKFFMNSFSLKS